MYLYTIDKKLEMIKVAAASHNSEPELLGLLRTLSQMQLEDVTLPRYCFSGVLPTAAASKRVASSAMHETGPQVFGTELRFQTVTALDVLGTERLLAYDGCFDV